MTSIASSSKLRNSISFLSRLAQRANRINGNGLILWKLIQVEQELPKSKDRVLLVSLSTSNPQFVGLYSQARDFANYLLEKLEFKRFASLYSSGLPAAITVSGNGVSDLAGVHFYRTEVTRTDLILLSGYGTPSTEEYEFSTEILSFARKIGVSQVISIGARWNEEPLSPFEEPKVLGFSTDEEGRKLLDNLGVSLQTNEPAYYFSNTIIGACPIFGLKGIKLSVNHGEPTPHPKSTIAFLNVFNKMLNISIDTASLEKLAKDLHESLNRSGITGATTIQNDQSESPVGKQDIYR